MAPPGKETLPWRSPPPIPLHSPWPVPLPPPPVREDIPEATSNPPQKYSLVLNFMDFQRKNQSNLPSRWCDTLEAGGSCSVPCLSNLILFKGVWNHCACIKVVVSELIVADESSLVWCSLTVGRFDQEQAEALLQLRGGAPALWRAFKATEQHYIQFLKHWTCVESVKSNVCV